MSTLQPEIEYEIPIPAKRNPYVRYKTTPDSPTKKEANKAAAQARRDMYNGGRGPYKKNKIAILYEQSNGNLTQEIARLLFNYDPETGILTRRINRSGNNGKAGEVAGTLSPDSGYLMVRVGKKSRPVHRVIWIWYHGYDPENQIDHRNRDRLDNSISNLREASPQCQARNRSNRSDCTSGVKGVSFCNRSKRWVATICIDISKSKHIAYCDDFIEAVCLRYAAEQCLSWNDCDANSPAYQYLKEQGILK